jgi:cytoskeletal protein CcmA (bactofilin family)
MNTANTFGGNPRGRNGSSGAGSAGSGTDGAVPADAETATIGAGVTIKGDVEAEVDLQINGRVDGDVRCATVILDERAVVTGSIVAERVRVAGRVEGGIEATDLALEAGAHVKGDVTYTRLRISNGGIFEGTMKHRARAEEPAAETERLKVVNGTGDAPQPQRVHYIE